jgi:hypothetical protein
MGNNFLNKFGLLSPFPEWIDAVYEIAQGITAAPVLWESNFTDKDFDDAFDLANDDLRTNANELFKKAAEEIKKSACASKVIEKMNIYTNAIMNNITAASGFLKNAFLNDAKNERAAMTNILTWFNNNATNCNNKASYILTLNCTSTLVRICVSLF